MNESKIANRILDSTPIMSSAVENTRTAIGEFYNLTDEYRADKKRFNEEAIKLFIKYDIITEENVEILREKGKL